MSRDTALPNDLMFLKLAGTELTRAEIRVLRLVARGLTLQEAADRIGVTRETVKSQTRMARGRLHAKTTAEAVAIAVSLDLI